MALEPARPSDWPVRKATLRRLLYARLRASMTSCDSTCLTACAFISVTAMSPISGRRAMRRSCVFTPISDSQARADQIVDLRFASPTGFCASWNALSRRLRLRQLHSSGKRASREFFAGRIAARRVGFEGQPQGFVRGF